MKNEVLIKHHPSNILTEIFRSEIIGEHELRVIGSYESPLFVAKDIANILGYKNTNETIRKHVDVEDKLSFAQLQKLRGSESLPQHIQGETILINESGLYSLILRSKLKAAKEFKRWVTTEVLPSIRKSGQYKMQQLELQLLEAKQTLQLKDKEITKINTNHQQLLKRQKRTVYEVGNVVYLISNDAFTTFYEDDYEKYGKATQKSDEDDPAFMRRLSNYNTSSPENFNVDSVFYVKDNALIEKCIETRFKNNKKPNKEWIKGVPKMEIIEFIRQQCDLLQCEYKEVVCEGKKFDNEDEESGDEIQVGKNDLICHDEDIAEIEKQEDSGQENAVEDITEVKGHTVVIKKAEGFCCDCSVAVSRRAVRCRPCSIENRNPKLPESLTKSAIRRCKDCKIEETTKDGELCRECCIKHVNNGDTKKCSGCDKMIYKTSERCNSCAQRLQPRKVNRPSLIQLRNDLSKMTYVTVGKKYGVSDNCIRKWLKSYESMPSLNK